MLVDKPELEDEIGAAARLAAENEALRAEALARLDDLRAARTETIGAGDVARRRLERDLHDGAQQQLVSIMYDLEHARAAAAERNDRNAALIATAAERVEAGFMALRELVQGIHPLVLAEAGLGPALATLADSAPIPLELGSLPRRRFGEATETGAYVTVAEGVGDAAARGATFVRADVFDAGDDLVVTINDDGAPRRRALPQVADRVGALGGSLAVSPNDLRVQLPCA